MSGDLHVFNKFSVGTSITETAYIMPSCSVMSCTNRKGLHMFPKDQEVRQEWIRQCHRSEGWIPPCNMFICDLHFLPQDFLPNGRLWKKAIPHMSGIYNKYGFHVGVFGTFKADPIAKASFNHHAH